ncbi:unnamed protein product [Protopolystoma xenopodis]|uniref:Uncharacterized protein n=1 Tax=Protopolystoma xenopodis TaxID=117903 RepID=A0A448WG58_9PLAT|nr:unnamed protein product [Protopolystoma xenopodis]
MLTLFPSSLPRQTSDSSVKSASRKGQSAQSQFPPALLPSALPTSTFSSNTTISNALLDKSRIIGGGDLPDKRSESLQLPSPICRSSYFGVKQTGHRSTMGGINQRKVRAKHESDEITLRQRGRMYNSSEKNEFTNPVSLHEKPKSHSNLRDTDDEEKVEEEQEADELVELLYDPVLDCYYDPTSERYFELR